MKKNDLAVGLAVGMACGVVLGAVAGLLLAPASGAETRRKLRYQREHAAEVARLRLQRTKARLRLVKPEEEEEQEEEGAFWGA